MAQKNLLVKGAREHNLKNVDIEIPRDKLVVFTGLSGSGKPYDTADITLFHMDTHVVQRVDGSVFS
mgnify:CR=1 FL=1